MEVMDLVANTFEDHFGDIDSFRWGVTRKQAVDALRRFLDFGLPRFGDFQDAMKSGEDILFHSAISPYLNVGLLTPREVCEAVLSRGREQDIPISSVEGFAR